MQDNYVEVSCSFSERPGFPYFRPRVMRYFDLTSDFSFHIPKWIKFEVQISPTPTSFPGSLILPSPLGTRLVLHIWKYPEVSQHNNLKLKLLKKLSIRTSPGNYYFLSWSQGWREGSNEWQSKSFCL